MADTVTTRTLFDGDKKLITSYVNVSDGSGGITKIVDVSALNTNAKGQTCTTVTLNKIWFNVSAAATAPIQIQWDLSYTNCTLQMRRVAHRHTDSYNIVVLVKNYVYLPPRATSFHQVIPRYHQRVFLEK